MKNTVGYAFRQYGIFLGFLGVIVILSVLEPRFLSYNNVINIFRQTSVIGIMAVGMTFVITAGGLDLSVGSMTALIAGIMIMVMNAPEVSTCQSWPRSPTNADKRAVSTVFSGLVPRNTSATSRSFQTHRNWKMANEAITGTDKGSTRRVNVVKGEAPSTYADSITSPGSEDMYPNNKNIARGRPNPVCANQTPRNSPFNLIPIRLLMST